MNIQNRSFKLKDGRTALIRSLSSRDIEQVIQLLELSGRETQHTLQFPGRVQQSPSEWTSRFLMSFGSPCRIDAGAFVEHKLIGFLGLRPIHEDHPWLRHIGTFGITVVKDCWGTGIADRLLNLIDEFAEVCGYSRIEACVRVANERGISLYLRNSYTIEGLRKSAAYIDGTYRDEYAIAKYYGAATGFRYFAFHPISNHFALTEWRISDASTCVRHLSDPAVQNMTLNIPHPYHSSDAYRWISAVHTEAITQQRILNFAIRNRESNEIVGSIGLMGIAQKYRAEVAYWIAKNYWGHGIATAALSEICRIAAEEFALKKLTAHTFASNQASARVLHKNGFNLEAKLPSHYAKDGRICDALMYSKYLETTPQEQ